MGKITMPWLPSFLNPWSAALAAAVAVPALLALYFLKLRRREMPVSSTILWRKAIQDLQVNAPFQKLRRNLLLLLQMLLLLLLCLALSRPVARYTKGLAKVSVILIDRSGSMSAMEDFNGRIGTRLDEAKRQAKALIDTMGRKESAMVIAFDDAAEVVTPLTTDASALRVAIDNIQPTDRKSRLKLAYKLAEAQVKYYPEQLRPNEKPTVFVFSDGRIADSKELTVQADVRYTKIGRDDTANVAIVSLSAKRNYERPTEVQVFARLANFGPEPVTTDVQLTVDGQIRGTATDLLLLPERWNDSDYKKTPDQEKLRPKDSVNFPKIDLQTAATLRVEQMKKDALASDDAAVVVVPPPKSLSVLLVSPDKSYYLRRILDTSGLEHPEQMLPEAYETARPQKFDVVMFDRYEPKFLPPSGNFIWFGALADGLRIKKIREGSDVAIMKDTYVLDWKREHPILAGVRLSKMWVFEALKLQVPIETEILVEGFKGPLVLLHREGRSTHLILTFDVGQSNWPLRLSFPVFMHNALQYLALGTDMDVRESFAPGSTPKIPRTSLQKLEADRGSPIKELTLDGPIGKRIVKIPDAGEIALPSLDRVGLYTVDPPVPQFEKIAVNMLDANESNLFPVNQPPGGGVVAESTSGKSRLELWWWIVACAALPLLLVEWWVYTRRVHL
jgi:uncharacterized protein YegL